MYSRRVGSVLCGSNSSTFFKTTKWNISPRGLQDIICRNIGSGIVELWAFQLSVFFFLSYNNTYKRYFVTGTSPTIVSISQWNSLTHAHLSPTICEKNLQPSVTTLVFIIPTISIVLYHLVLLLYFLSDMLLHV